MRYDHINDSALERASRVLREEGALAVLSRAATIITREVGEPLHFWLHRALHPAGSFTFAGRDYPYFIHRHNMTFLNERAVEIAIALDWVERRRGFLLEVGDVLGHYRRVDWTVVDKFDRRPGVVNSDIVDYRPADRFDLAFSLSTLEHVGFDEEPREPGKAARAVASILRHCLKPGGRLLFTVPVGYNLDLDERIARGEVPLSEARYLLRVGPENRWREAAPEEVRGTRYGTPYPCANAILVAVATAAA